MQSETAFEYTLNMKTIVREKFSMLKSYYCREDFELALSDMDNATKDSVKFRMETLKKLCDARGINAEELILDRTILRQIPDRVQMQENLLQAFYDMYLNFPKTTDFMERLVRRLAPEYSDDTIRTVILKKFLGGVGDNFRRFKTEQIMEWGKRRFDRAEKSSFNALEPKQKRNLIISKIEDSIFEHISVDLTAVEIFRLIANRMKKCKEDTDIIFDEIKLSVATTDCLDEILNMNHLTGKETASEKILTIVSALDTGIIAEEEAEKQMDGLFIKNLERDFRDQLRITKRKSKKTGVNGNADELYKNDKKDARKKATNDWELLKLCNDLANGNFRTNGKTKIYLYYFALMFKMIVPSDDTIYDRDEKQFEYWQKHRDEIKEEEIYRKYVDYSEKLENVLRNLSLTAVMQTFILLNREELFLFRRLLNGIERCYELLHETEIEKGYGNIDAIREALKKVKEVIVLKDINKSLFQDYYNDNLLRILEGDYVNPKMVSTFEKEPTGEGINYKNFVEAIYLYFISHDDLNMLPGEKIDAAEAVIEKCIKLAKKAGNSKKISAGEYTELYKKNHINILLNKKIDEIADYVAENYLVISPDNAGLARIMVASEENTAFDLVGSLMEDLDAEYPNIELFDVRQKDDMTRDIKEDIAFNAGRAFDWKVKSLLEERFSEDTNFIKVVSALDERVHVNNGRFSKMEKVRMITLLHVLVIFSSEADPMSMYKIQTHMEEKGIVSVGTQLGNSLNVLGNIGYDIQRSGDSYYIGRRDYSDKTLDELLKRVSGRYLMVTEDMELMISELLVQRLKFDKRITRSELISIHFNYYIALLNETEEMDTFPDIFEDYAATISPILEEARYQPLSEKNIFDMYVVTALYFYLVENNGYMQ